MNKRKIEVSEIANDIVKALPAGILMTTKSGEKVNSMVIGWGMVGFNWRKWVFTAFVRESRYTKGLVDANREFTLNIPVGVADKKRSRRPASPWWIRKSSPCRPSKNSP